MAASTAKQGRLFFGRFKLVKNFMTICLLGTEWADLSKIPVKEIVEEWRMRSSHAMWKAAGLEEPSGCWKQQEGGAVWVQGEQDGARAFEDEEGRMDNLRAHPEWQR